MLVNDFRYLIWAVLFHNEFYFHASHQSIHSNGVYLILEGISSFEMFMNLRLGRDMRDRFTQWLEQLEQIERRLQTFSAGFTLSPVDNSYIWGFNFYLCSLYIILYRVIKCC